MCPRVVLFSSALLQRLLQLYRSLDPKNTMLLARVSRRSFSTNAAPPAPKRTTSSAADEAVIPHNHLKRKLKTKDYVAVGCMICEVRQPSILQVLKNAKMDFVIIDNEHGPFGIETIADMSRMGAALRITPIVRTYQREISRVLDAGAQGIMIPQVSLPGHLIGTIKTAKFPPWGERGNALSRGYTRFLSGDVSAVMQRSNAASMIITQIETKGAMEKLDELLKLKGIDVALVGPNDLSIALGVPGQMQHPTLIDAIKKVIDRCKANNVVPGIHVNDLASATFWKAEGMRMISVGSELSYMHRSAKEVTSKLWALGSDHTQAGSSRKQAAEEKEKEEDAAEPPESSAPQSA